jgi:hypothetical protein
MRLLRILLSRLVLAAIPFAVYYAWRLYLKSRGRNAPAPPWGWLIAAAAVTVGVSILLKVAITPSNLGRTYIPAQTQPDGSIKPGRYQ